VSCAHARIVASSAAILGPFPQHGENLPQQRPDVMQDDSLIGHIAVVGALVAG